MKVCKFTCITSCAIFNASRWYTAIFMYKCCLCICKIVYVCIRMHTCITYKCTVCKNDWSAVYSQSFPVHQIWLQYSPSLNTVTSFPAWILSNYPLEWERATGGKNPDCLIYVAYTLRGVIARFFPQKRHNEELSCFCIMDRFSYTGLCWYWSSGGRDTQWHNLLC